MENFVSAENSSSTSMDHLRVFLIEQLKLTYSGKEIPRSLPVN